MLVAAALAAASTAQATWSVIVSDTRTGEIGVASATCLAGFDLRDASPVLIPGVGAATAQATVDATGQNRVKVRDLLVQGVHPDDIVATLSQFDPSHQARQYGIVDTMGRASTFSGSGIKGWTGGRTGRTGDLVYAVQGNVLAGEAVVNAAMQAIIDTPGDLAQKLMAAMGAAAAMGGDGRCSCSSSNPTQCGTPPAGFAKSAHVGFVLISRAGDVPGCNGVVRAGARPLDATVRDIDGDGRLDVAVCSEGTTLGLENRWQSGDAFVSLVTSPPLAAAADTRAVAVADITRDGIADLIFAGYGADVVGVQAGNGDGTFRPAVVNAAGDGPRQLVTGDFNGDGWIDVAAANQLSGDVSVFLNKGGFLGPQVRYAVGASPVAIVAGDLNRDGDLELAVLAAGSRLVVVLSNSGTGSYSLAVRMTSGSGPSDLAILDADGDGDLDLVTADRGAGSLTLFSNTGYARFNSSVISVPAPPSQVRGADMTGDGAVDLVVASEATRRAYVLKGNGKGAFAQTAALQLNDALLDLELGDLNADGTPDLIGVGSGIQSVVVVESIAPGQWNNGIGCSTGDFFAAFNVANASTSDPDPVTSLQALFDAWRADRVGRPDAVMSRVNTGGCTLSARGSTEMWIELLDWRGQPITMRPSEVTVEHSLDSAALATIGDVGEAELGLYWVRLDGSESGPGEDRFVITAFDGLRPVVLMPGPTLWHSGNLARPRPLLRRVPGT